MDNNDNILIYSRNRKPNWTDDENVIFLEEYGKRKHIIQSTLNAAAKQTCTEDVARNNRQKCNKYQCFNKTI